MRQSILLVAGILSASCAALAAPIPAEGITRQELADVLLAQGYRAALETASNGAPVIRSAANGVNFSVYFHRCNAAGRCGDVQFSAGWPDANVAQERVNQWNAEKQFLETYSLPGNKLFVEMDVIAKHTSTENMADVIAKWAAGLADFKLFMKL